jgi:hypothetical protein
MKGLKMSDKIYLVRYHSGRHVDCWDTVIFATTSQSKAKKYVAKFNRILKKWKAYYKQFEEEKFGMFPWIADKYVEEHFDRYSTLQMINKCYYTEVKVRE